MTFDKSKVNWPKPTIKDYITVFELRVKKTSSRKKFRKRFRQKLKAYLDKDNALFDMLTAKSSAPSLT